MPIAGATSSAFAQSTDRRPNMPDNIRLSNPDTMQKPPGYSHVVEVTGPGRTVYFAGQLSRSAVLVENISSHEMRPPPAVGARANAVIPRSICSASSTPIGLTSTPNDGAAPWMAPASSTHELEYAREYSRKRRAAVRDHVLNRI